MHTYELFNQNTLKVWELEQGPLGLIEKYLLP